MDDITLGQMQEMQRCLQERYKEKWTPLSPETARNHLLWMIIEAGEAADIIKKKGDDAIMDNPEVRRHFVEELCDVLMYWSDVALSYSIAPEEIREIYLEKHQKNMGRW